MKRCDGSIIVASTWWCDQSCHFSNLFRHGNEIEGFVKERNKTWSGRQTSHLASVVNPCVPPSTREREMGSILELDSPLPKAHLPQGTYCTVENSCCDGLARPRGADAGSISLRLGEMELITIPF